MATVNFRIRSKANKPVSIFIYVSLETGNVISTPSGFNVHPKDWSNQGNNIDYSVLMVYLLLL